MFLQLFQAPWLIIHTRLDARSPEVPRNAHARRQDRIVSSGAHQHVAGTGQSRVLVCNHGGHDLLHRDADPNGAGGLVRIPTPEVRHQAVIATASGQNVDTAALPLPVVRGDELKDQPWKVLDVVHHGRVHQDLLCDAKRRRVGLDRFQIVKRLARRLSDSGLTLHDANKMRAQLADRAFEVQKIPQGRDSVFREMKALKELV